jgi:membrane protease YdiL (CAAX protease family)
MSATETIVAIIVSGMAIVVSTLVWGWIVSRWTNGREPLVVEPRQPVPWRLVEVAIVIAISVIFQLVVVQVLQSALDIDRDAGIETLSTRNFVLFNLGSTLAQIGAIVLVLFLLPYTCGATRIDLGFDMRQLRRDYRIGVVAFFAIAPPVYLLQALLSYYFPEQHPYIEKLRSSPEFGSYFVIAISVLLIAPLVEEFVFRVLLQGWLERQFETPFSSRPSGGLERRESDTEADGSSVPNSGLSAFSFLRAGPFLIS